MACLVSMILPFSIFLFSTSADCDKFPSSCRSDEDFYRVTLTYVILNSSFAAWGVGNVVVYLILCDSEHVDTTTATDIQPEPQAPPTPTQFMETSETVAYAALC